MKKKISAILTLITILSFHYAIAGVTAFEVAPRDVHEGYIVKKIWLGHFSTPAVTISDIGYMPVSSLPAGVQLADPRNIEVSMGMERKRPFAVVRIPAFASGGAAGSVNQVARFTLTVDEQPQVKGSSPAAKMTAADVSVSALATGTWYKIGIATTGFFKIDPAFISTMGLNPADINPANIRIYGNGGNMLSEDNNRPYNTDLVENAIMVSDNGNGSFESGEYAVFYATGPTAWLPDSANKRFVHEKNIYSDTAYYFITFNSGAGLRIAGQPATGTPNRTVNSFNYYVAHDSDAVNPAGIGKIWYGAAFYPQAGNTAQSFSFDMGGYVSDVYCAVSFAGTSSANGNQLSVTLNGNLVSSAYLAPTAAGGNLISIIYPAAEVACNSQTANVRLAFNYVDNAAVGYLNYIELNARRGLSMTGEQMSFRDWESVGAGNIATYQISGAGGNTRVWDVTNRQVPVLMNGSLSGSVYSFTQDAGTLHEFAAINGTNLYTPKYIGTVANQNLHGSGQVDFIIVTHPSFLDQATQLAAYHTSHDKMKVLVATTNQVYNEFSSGGQDISAIRNLARMFYKRAGTDSAAMPHYLLLLGGASYDYKYRLPNNSNFVPVFESAESQHDVNSYSTDDFYGYLDDNENMESVAFFNALDMGVGRFPARNAEEASVMVNKVISYTSPATLGVWRIAATVAADNGYTAGRMDPAGDHMADAEIMSGSIAKAGNEIYNQQKIYVDAIPVISTPAGARCPNANAALNEQVFKGTFVINYNGHGSTSVWAEERMLTQDDYNLWNNEHMLPFMITATCDFGQFDHPQYVSAAEELVMRKNGGVIAVLTTTKAVYANYNREINGQYLNAQFSKNADGTWKTFGEASRIGKNETYLTSKNVYQLANFRKFALLGDPALTPDFPQYNVQLDSVKDGITMAHADTVKALGAYIIDGSVRDNDGNVLTGFNGLVTVTFYDKPRTIATITGTSKTFTMQDNIVYKGRVTVANGLFSLTFITPKDINYFFGKGKVSMYAHNGITDAAGTDSNFAVGGFSSHPQYNEVPPVVRPYINDSLFLNGGITGSNTSLYVALFSETGINVSGNNVGHDLTAILDDNLEAPYILNDYYETAPNTYQRGYVTFPVKGLADGKHTIKVKAWDVNNNVGEGTVEFMVINGKLMAIQNLGNYPNPFSGSTHFIFEHNHPDEKLDAEIDIFSVSGEIVRNIKETFTPGGSRTNEITWDGTANNGGRIPSGVYVYRLSITTEKGFRAAAYQKLVIVR